MLSVGTNLAFELIGTSYFNLEEIDVLEKA
jgi:hypothetical protein